jgi:glutamate racemase
VIACNTASSVALEALQEALAPVPVIGVIEPGARAGVSATRNKRIGVLATESTVKGGAYARAIHRLMADAEITQLACQVFVALAEEGWADTRATAAAVEDYLDPLFARADAPDTLVLGCTHFPILTAAIQRHVGDAITLVDSAQTTAAAVAETLANSTLQAGGGSPRTVRFFATDSPERFARIGATFFGQDIDEGDVALVDLKMA